MFRPQSVRRNAPLHRDGDTVLFSPLHHQPLRVLHDHDRLPGSALDGVLIEQQFDVTRAPNARRSGGRALNEGTHRSKNSDAEGVNRTRAATGLSRRTFSAVAFSAVPSNRADWNAGALAGSTNRSVVGLARHPCRRQKKRP